MEKPWKQEKMDKAEARCYEIYRIVSDILYEGERGKVNWVDALEQMNNELGEQ